MALHVRWVVTQIKQTLKRGPDVERITCSLSLFLCLFHAFLRVTRANLSKRPVALTKNKKILAMYLSKKISLP